MLEKLQQNNDWLHEANIELMFSEKNDWTKLQR